MKGSEDRLWIACGCRKLDNGCCLKDLPARWSVLKYSLRSRLDEVFAIVQRQVGPLKCMATFSRIAFRRCWFFLSKRTKWY